MHADALYQRVLEHEQAVEAAREAGIPPPIFNPVIPQRPAAAAQEKALGTNAMRDLLVFGAMLLFVPLGFSNAFIGYLLEASDGSADADG